MRVEPRWAGQPCIVAASGPSLTASVVSRVRYTRLANKWRVIAVNDVYKVMPWADAMYATDNHWWEEHQTCEGFSGEKWASHEVDKDPAMQRGNDKSLIADKYGLNLVNGQEGSEFSFDPAFIRYGWNSGFQAVNLALLFGCRRIVLVGFDMRFVNGKSHFFGDHKGNRQSPETAYERFAQRFATAAKKLPADVSIVNATPGSALTCFPMMSLEDACREKILGDDRVHRDGSELNAAAG